MVIDFDIVVAADRKRGIGKEGRLPWHLPGDLKYFRKLTSTTKTGSYQNAVIMGRKTWESIPLKHRPLNDRLNVVLTKDADYKVPNGVLKVASLDDALELLQDFPVETCFVIGGGQIYDLCLRDNRLRKVYLTEVDAEFDCDTFLPDYESAFEEIFQSQPHNENGLSYKFRILRKKKEGDPNAS
ncbi:MAG: dihydrofolate reductase [Candidatus Obscuribacterales bacterium]|nr:dihydrofolate reductase [Candidatus Obscuribacterales bacterium]